MYGAGLNQRARIVGVLTALLLVVGAIPASARSGYEIVTGQTTSEVCDELEADYAFAVTGDLEGCIYGVITKSRIHEGLGIYQEVADETFIGRWGSHVGTFEMTEFYYARFDPDTGDLLAAGCRHPVIAGSGTGGLAGMAGQLDFIDDVETGIAYYKGRVTLGA